ncbi:MAG: hypothetical protein JRE43_01510 [Deltaproteobacteria bacterium]|jgi:hypothetical protein|nr:hypothetical protein [Deltaproteobacteria bacterium]
MELYTLIGEIVAGIIYLSMGVQLYRLSTQSRQIPDRLLSVTLLAWGLSYLVYDAFVIVAGPGAEIAPWVSFSSVFVRYLGSIAFASFTRSVFRRREAWALWLVAAIAIGLVAGLVGSVLMGDWSGGDPVGNPWYWPKWACGAAPLVWMGAEGFSHFAKARQRCKLGLCKPLDANRYLLWGLAGVLWAVLEIVVIGQDVVYQQTGAWSASVGLAVCWLEIVPVVLIWLVFFPPAGYRRWIDGPIPAAS